MAFVSMNDGYSRYLFEYRHDGSEWGIEIVAKSQQDAQERLKAISWAHYKGEVAAKIPDWQAGRFLAFEDAIDVDRHFPNNASAAEITSSCGFALQYPDNLSASADSLSRSTTGGPFFKIVPLQPTEHDIDLLAFHLKQLLARERGKIELAILRTGRNGCE